MNGISKVVHKSYGVALLQSVGIRFFHSKTTPRDDSTGHDLHLKRCAPVTELSGTSYMYEASGNLNRSMMPKNRLAAVKDSDGNTIAFFTYRADGMRKTMTTPSGAIPL